MEDIDGGLHPAVDGQSLDDDEDDDRFLDRLFGLVVKASTSRAGDPGFDSRFHRGDLSRSGHTSDF